MSNQAQAIIVSILATVVAGVILLTIEYGWFSPGEYGTYETKTMDERNPAPPVKIPPNEASANPFIKPKPILTLSKPAGPPGTALTVHGSRFAAGETIVIRFDGMMVMGRVPADEHGKFDKDVQIPKDTKFPTGSNMGSTMHTIGAKGMTSDITASEFFEVSPSYKQPLKKKLSGPRS